MSEVLRGAMSSLLVLALLGGAPSAARSEALPPAIAVAGAADVKTLTEALRLKDVFEVMEEEGRAYGADLEEQMFPGRGGESWKAEVAGIYDADRILPAFVDAFARALAGSDAEVAPMLAFLDSPTGRKAVGLEVSARRAMLDDAVEDAAKLKAAELRDSRDPRFAALKLFAETNDLVEANVTSGMNASLAFYTGLAEAGAMGDAHSEQEMLQDVWSQEATLRADTEEWVFSFLNLAYAPLTDEELGSYQAFSASPAGKRLNAALFEAFDVVFSDISRRLGQAAGRRIIGEDL